MNNRLHHLERIIRYEYKCFDTLCAPKKISENYSFICQNY